MSQPMENLDGLFDFYTARHKEKCSRGDERLVQCSELGRAKLRVSRHKIFPEKIGVLDHRALDWLKNYAALFQIFRNNVALDQLIVRENHASRVLIEAARILQNIFAVVF